MISRPCVTVTFTALASKDTWKTTARTTVTSGTAHWQSVELGGNCALLQQATRTILPAFSTRNVKLISWTDCNRLHVGLRAEVLKPLEEAPSP